MIYCDPETGTCTVSTAGEGISVEEVQQLEDSILYFGDPLCSWCWGIAPALNRLYRQYSPRLEFRLIMGGLRPGGGDSWNQKFRSYLHNHWEHVQEKSGQPFNFDLLELDSFDYDTEPPCRAVKVAQSFDIGTALSFYHDIQRRFYVENENPGVINFYKPICEKYQIPFDDFSERFTREEFKRRTRDDFSFARQIGVSAFPTVLLYHEGQLNLVAYGFTPFDQMSKNINQVLESN